MSSNELMDPAEATRTLTGQLPHCNTYWILYNDPDAVYSSCSPGKEQLKEMTIHYKHSKCAQLLSQPARVSKWLVCLF